MQNGMYLRARGPNQVSSIILASDAQEQFYVHPVSIP
jgi:hypothetical protein